jgi:aprataxin
MGNRGRLSRRSQYAVSLISELHSHTLLIRSSFSGKRHLHLHVISTDLISPTLKNKKHYASFHPTFGFFVPLADVLQSLSSRMASQPGKNNSSFNIEKYVRPNGPKAWDPILRNELSCWQCDQVFPNVPALKRHLEEEWARLKKASQTSKG